MGDPYIASDQVTWMRPYWADLHKDPFFARLAPELQAKALAEAIEPEHPSHAVEVRRWNPTTRRAMLVILDQSLKTRTSGNVTPLWRAQKDGAREIRCVAVHLPTGIDLRLLEGNEMRRTELFRDGPSLLVRSRQWRTALVRTGWQDAAL